MFNNLRKAIIVSLRWSEGYTKTDMVYLASGGFWTGFSVIAMTATSLIVTIVYAHFLPKDVYGIYRYILSVVTILSIATLPGVNTAFIQSIARGQFESLSAALRLKFTWGIWASFGAMVIALYYALQGNQAYALMFMISAVALPIVESLTVYDSILQGKHDFRTSAIYGFVVSFITSASLIFAALVKPSAPMLVAVYFASQFIARLIVFRWTRSRYKDILPIISKEMTTYGKHLTVMKILAVISDQLDKILVYHYLGPVQLAIYSFATIPVDKLKGLFRSIALVLLPHYSRTDRKHVALGRSTLMFTMALTVATLAYIVAAPHLFALLFPAYEESLPYTWLYAPSLILASWVPNIFLTAYSAIREKYILSAALSTIKIVLLLVGGYFYGIVGIICAMLFASLSNLTLSYYLARQIQGSDKTTRQT